MRFADLPAYMSDLRACDDLSAHALELTIITAARTSETIEAEWSEFDLNAKKWTVPAERMKGEKEHYVPLSRRAVAILELLPRSSEYVFPSTRTGRPLSNMAMLEFLQGKHPNLTVHGFRSTFRDWAAECTNHPEYVVEMALAHAVGDKVEAAYRRGDLFMKRVRLMDDWARYCESDAAPLGAEIIDFAGARSA